MKIKKNKIFEVSSNYSTDYVLASDIDDAIIEYVKNVPKDENFVIKSARYIGELLNR